ncbi:hypothetical protein V8G54_021391 [Vigna mungo]|uniref:Uncharacterized protein n=1 Tax=Vigna mungo TaxID=3915 RepID=A0AAQ3NDZ9_VIGMU
MKCIASNNGIPSYSCLLWHLIKYTMSIVDATTLTVHVNQCTRHKTIITDPSFQSTCMNLPSNLNKTQSSRCPNHGDKRARSSVINVFPHTQKQPKSFREIPRVYKSTNHGHPRSRVSLSHFLKQLSCIEHETTSHMHKQYPIHHKQIRLKLTVDHIIIHPLNISNRSQTDTSTHQSIIGATTHIKTIMSNFQNFKQLHCLPVPITQNQLLYLTTNRRRGRFPDRGILQNCDLSFNMAPFLWFWSQPSFHGGTTYPGKRVTPISFL